MDLSQQDIILIIIIALLAYVVYQNWGGCKACREGFPLVDNYNKEQYAL